MLSERTCSFSLQQDQRQLSAQSSTRCPSSPSSSHRNSVNLDDFSPSTISSVDVASQSSQVESSYSGDFEDPINFDHMELLVHFTQSEELFNISERVQNDRKLVYSIGLKEAFKAPYLMYEMLAFAAQHLAFLRPERSSHYLHESISLQTRAISLFNATRTHITRDNCVAVLLFSTVLGHHLLADTLQGPHRKELDDFIEHFVQCAEIRRGVYVIAETAWPLLMESELEPILSKSLTFTSRMPIGKECDAIKTMIKDAENMTEEEKDACYSSIRYLQVGFDAVEGIGDVVDDKHQMIYSWTMLMPSKMRDLLLEKRPEALVILAYYSVLLHHAASLWQARTAGPYVLDLINSKLGPQLQSEMQFPRRVIHGRSLADRSLCDLSDLF